MILCSAVVETNVELATTGAAAAGVVSGPCVVEVVVVLLLLLKALPINAIQTIINFGNFIFLHGFIASTSFEVIKFRRYKMFNF